MRICFVTPLPPPFGGISNWATQVVKFFEVGGEVEVETVNIAPEWKSVHQRSKIVRSIGGGLQLFRDYFRFLKKIKNSDCCHLASSGSLAMIRDFMIAKACNSRKVPLVYHMHFGRIPEIEKHNTMEWKLFRLVSSKCAAVVVLDEDSRKVVAAEFNNKIVVKLPNPIDLSPIDVKAVKKQVVFIGWVLKSKGVEDLLDAWARLDDAEWTLTIVGPGDETYVSGLLERYAGPRIDYRGELPHDKAIDVLRESAILTLPSHSEGFPMVVLEAMMLGKPVIASSVGGIPEMLSSGAGLLVEPKNIDDLVANFKIMINNETQRNQMGIAGRQKVEREYQTSVVMSDLKNIWEMISNK